MDLHQYLWRNRVLLLYGPSESHLLVLRQLQMFEDRRPDLTARQTVTIYAGPGKFTLVLIGKDGTEKHRWHEPTPVDHISELIDRMPMRRQEVQQSPKP